MKTGDRLTSHIDISSLKSEGESLDHGTKDSGDANISVIRRADSNTMKQNNLLNCRIETESVEVISKWRLPNERTAEIYDYCYDFMCSPYERGYLV